MAFLPPLVTAAGASTAASMAPLAASTAALGTGAGAAGLGATSAGLAGLGSAGTLGSSLLGGAGGLGLSKGLELAAKTGAGNIGTANLMGSPSALSSIANQNIWEQIVNAGKDAVSNPDIQQILMDQIPGLGSAEKKPNAKPYEFAIPRISQVNSTGSNNNVVRDLSNLLRSSSK